MLLDGRVVRSQSRSFEIETTQGPISAVVLKGLRSRYPGFVDPVAVGDRVKVRLGAGTEANIVEVLPRSNRLSRPAVGRESAEQLIAANLSRAVVVQAVAPAWKPATYDRYMVMASAGDVPVALCLNKSDLEPQRPDAGDLDIYRALDVPVIITSAKTGEGLDELRSLLRGGTSVFIGPSGVGKSSLINALGPGIALRTGSLSRSTGKGRHTTTWVELLAFEDGIEVVDSPGLRVLGLWGVEPETLARHFPEIRDREGGCRFTRCTHLHEPDCPVREAVDRGEIAPSRYESYRRIYRTLESGESRGPRGR